MANKNGNLDPSPVPGGRSHGSLRHHHVHGETRSSDAELIRLADAYTINMLDDARPLPGDDTSIEESVRAFLEYMREGGYALAEHHHPFSPDDLEAWRARRCPAPGTPAQRSDPGR